MKRLFLILLIIITIENVFGQDTMEENPFLGDPWVLISPYYLFGKYSYSDYENRNGLHLDGYALYQFVFKDDNRMEIRDTDEIGNVIDNKIVIDEYSISPERNKFKFPRIDFLGAIYYYTILSASKILLLKVSAESGNIIKPFFLIRASELLDSQDG